MTRRIEPYPWHALERVDREVVRALARARQKLHELRPDGLAPALGEIIGADVELVVRRVCASGRKPRGLCSTFDVAGRAARITLGIEPGAAARVLRALLGHSGAVDRLDAAADPAVLGALAAVVVEVVRRAGGLPDLAPSAPEVPGFEARCRAMLEVTLLIDGRAYGLDVLIEVDEQPAPLPEPELALLGSLAIPLTLVAGLSSATRAELSTLEIGGAFMPADGFWIDARGAGRVALASALSERGVAADLASDGRIVLRGDRVALTADVEHAMTEDEATTQVVSEAVLEAPLVVRVELGTLTLTAREWAKLRPGDVIETGHRIAEPVVLRVAGQEVARGELVDVEGELGVRIRELVRGEI